MCKTHLHDTADKLVSEYLRERDGECKARTFLGTPCNGQLTAMHIVRRGYLALRWDTGNLAAGCWGHHYLLTVKPDEHYAWAEWYLGAKRYAQLRGRRFDQP